jgi:phospholipid-binding lipoprotein MlaA
LILHLLAPPILLAAGLCPAANPAEVPPVAVLSEAPVPQLAIESEALALVSPQDDFIIEPKVDPPTPQPDAAQPSDNEILVTAQKRNPADPLAKINITSFAVTQTIDENFTAPLAHAYEHGLPKPLRQGLHNFLSNLHEPVVFINFLLQHKIGKAAETLGRFAIDTTIGVAGVVDVAKRHPFNLPRRPNGFADTLGYYGVKPGAFLFLPLMGPTTVRDLAGGLLDRLVLPGIPNTPFAGPTWAVPAAVVHTLDQRVAFDDELARQRASDDPYRARRDYYLHRRQAEIDALHGRAEPSEPAPAAVNPGG